MVRLIAVFVFLTFASCSTPPKKSIGPGPSACGNGQLDSGELCDPNIANGSEGACPTDCGDDACSGATLVGDPAQCTAQCEIGEPTCANDDGCCATGCDSTNDNDCTNTCGNDIVEDPETCDGNCGDCASADACSTAVTTGDAATCSFVCTFETVETCDDGDGCCPANCDSSTDSDCSDSCGDGVIDDGETCDGNCPTDCVDNNDCTDDVLIGSASNCTAACTNDLKTACTNDDGCCPQGCTFANDNDCTCTPNNTCAMNGWTCGQIDNNGCNMVENCGTCNAATEVCSVNNTCELTYNVGDPCTEQNNQCFNGLCFTEELTGQEGGYCTKDCTSDAECGANHCVIQQGETTGVCLQSCVDNADCRAGHECYDRDGDNRTECFSVGVGNRAIGDQCDNIQDCAGGQAAFCILESQGALQGYCSSVCQNNNDCAAGSHCAGTLCVKDCNTAADCRGNGYDCYDWDQAGVNECMLSGTGATPPGGQCQGTWECSGGADAFCATDADGFQDGYCIIFCGPGQGTCPNGSTCYDTMQNQEFCVDDCVDVNDCRAGYDCTDFGVVDACWPIP